MEKEFNQMEYINKYNKQTYKKYTIMIRKDNEAVINHLEKQANKTGYILKLIEEDMKK